MKYSVRALRELDQDIRMGHRWPEYRKAIETLLVEFPALLAEGSLDVLVAFLVDWSPHLVRSEAFQRDLLTELPDEWFTAVYQDAANLEERRAIAALVPRPDLLHALILKAWTRANLAEAAMLYYSAFDCPDNMVMYQERGLALNDCPRELIKALYAYRWDTNAIRAGIINWLDEELNP